MARIGKYKETFLYSLTIQPDGKIMAAGTTWLGWTEYHTTICRVNTDGSMDTNMGSKGINYGDWSWDNNRAYSIVIQPDNWILTAGYSNKNVTKN